jgi:hypothetical protein
MNPHRCVFEEWGIEGTVMDKGEIILYRPQDDDVTIDVLVESETVWLTLDQMAELFERDKSTISRHVSNVFKEGELDRAATVANFATVQIEGGREVVGQIDHHNLDVIISVGYRVKSRRGVQFRIWATRVLKEYILRGYAINSRVEHLEHQMTDTVSRITNNESRIAETEKQIQFFVKTALPPVEGIFCDGQIFDAYSFASDLVKRAKKRIILFDNYVDETVLALLLNRKAAVSATIYTKRISRQLQLDLAQHNAQYALIGIQTTDKYHDRFMIIDDTVYHIGASMKDLGKKLFAFSMIGIKPTELLKNI